MILKIWSECYGEDKFSLFYIGLIGRIMIKFRNELEIDYSLLGDIIVGRMF